MSATKECAAWVINVAGYGAFLFKGSEQEAEETRAQKARWERGVGRKRPATPEEAKGGEISRCINHEGYGNRVFFADCPCDDMNCVIDAATRIEGGAK